jgi:Domain of unknown function (DUF397)
MSEDEYATWRKSSYSSGTGNCVEVAFPEWRKSSHSDGTGNCVEVTGADRLVAIRDTKQGGRGPTLEFTGVAWQAFIAEAKGDKKDL